MGDDDGVDSEKRQVEMNGEDPLGGAKPRRKSLPRRGAILAGGITLIVGVACPVLWSHTHTFHGDGAIALGVVYIPRMLPGGYLAGLIAAPFGGVVDDIGSQVLMTLSAVLVNALIAWFLLAAVTALIRRFRGKRGECPDEDQVPPA